MKKIEDIMDDINKEMDCLNEKIQSSRKLTQTYDTNIKNRIPSKGEPSDIDEWFSKNGYLINPFDTEFTINDVIKYVNLAHLKKVKSFIKKLTIYDCNDLGCPMVLSKGFSKNPNERLFILKMGKKYYLIDTGTDMSQTANYIVQIKGYNKL